MALAGPWVRSAALSHASNCFPSSLAAKKINKFGTCLFLLKYSPSYNVAALSKRNLDMNIYSY